MAIYGFCVSAPLNHVLVGQLQKTFAGKTGLKAKLLQLLANNLLVSPVTVSGEFRPLYCSIHPSSFFSHGSVGYVSTTSGSRDISLCHFFISSSMCTHLISILPIAYLASMAIINGATSVDEIIKTVKAGFFSVIRVCSLSFHSIISSTRAYLNWFVYL